jgi:hypothetical protein
VVTSPGGRPRLPKRDVRVSGHSGSNEFRSAEAIRTRTSGSRLGRAGPRGFVST